MATLRRLRHRRWRIISVLLGVLLFPLLILAGAVILTPLPADPLAAAPAESTRILDSQGRLLAELPAGGWHTSVALAQIPIALQQATIAAEDSSFYQNPGVDALAIGRAAFLDVRSLGHTLYGGSTITQQLVRNLYLTPSERQSDNLGRKIHEALLALRITRTLSKDQLLALYLNSVFYGHLAYGVQAAAQAFFGRPVAMLDVAQCALLAGLPRAPSLYDPLVDPAAALRRRNEVLHLMAMHGYLAHDQEQQAISEPLGLAGSDSLLGVAAPHFVNYVISLLDNSLGPERVRQGGLVVTTTLNLDDQHIAETAIARQVAVLSKHYARDAALVSIDPRSGNILAMVGSAGYSNNAIAGSVNVALSPRQPGSAIKMFTYVAAMQDGDSPATVVADVPRTFMTRDGQPYQPLNYDLTYHGLVSLRTALGSSLNVPAVTVLQQVGIAHMLAVAHAMGITTLNDARRFGLALTLGGGEVRLLDLTSAYGVLATAGVRHPAVAILSVRDAAGHDLGSWTPGTAEQVLGPHGPQVAALLTSMLSDDTARFIGFGEGSPLVLSRPAAVKTGTTTDWRDNWTVGYTPELVTGVWVGNADDTPMIHVSGITGAAPIWHEYMEQALAQTPPSAFQLPNGLVRRTVCVESGLLATPLCPHQATDLFIAGTEPRQLDNTFRAYLVDIATGRQASASTPRSRISHEVVETVPPIAQAWAREQGLLIDPPLPPASSVAAVAHDGSAIPLSTDPLLSSSVLPQITAPEPDSVYGLSISLPTQDQQILIAAQPGAGNAPSSLDLLLDGRQIAHFDSPPYQTYWTLTTGEHQIKAIVHLSNGATEAGPAIKITVMPADQTLSASTQS